MNWRGIGGGGRGGEVMNKRLAKSEVSRLPKRKENGQLEQHCGWSTYQVVTTYQNTRLSLPHSLCYLLCSVSLWE